MFFQPPIPYEYQYTVQDPLAPLGPLDFGHQEARDAQVTTGQYSVLLPDGRVQVSSIVQYNKLSLHIDLYRCFINKLA